MSEFAEAECCACFSIGCSRIGLSADYAGGYPFATSLPHHELLSLYNTLRNLSVHQQMSTASHSQEMLLSAYWPQSQLFLDTKKVLL